MSEGGEGQSRVVVALLVGLPGVGKSTFSSKLKTFLEGDRATKPIHVVHVCYDQLIPLHVQREFVLLKQTGEEGDSEGTDWKAARQVVHTRVEQLLRMMKTRETNTSASHYFGVSGEYKKYDYHLILLDDNFYYRSMRYKYYQLARNHAAGYCLFYIDCSTSVAIKQNSQRGEQVPLEVIEAMATKLQPPLPQEHTWEANTYCILAGHDPDFEAIQHLLQSCFLCPVPPLPDVATQAAEARVVCSQSVLHQADLLLRALVGQLITHHKQHNKNTLSSFSRQVNSARHGVLAALKAGSLTLPAHLATVSDENKPELQAFVTSELNKQLTSSTQT